MFAALTPLTAVRKPGTPTAALGAPKTPEPHQQRLSAVGGVGQAPGASLAVSVVSVPAVPGAAVAGRVTSVGAFGLGWVPYTMKALLCAMKVWSVVLMLATLTTQLTRPALTWAWVGGQTAFSSGAEKLGLPPVAVTVMSALPLPLVSVCMVTSDARSNNRSLAEDGLTTPPSALVWTT